MTTLSIILTEDFADWEAALLGAVTRGFYGGDVLYASPGGMPVTSMGGLCVKPGLALEQIELDRVDAVVVSGGTLWAKPGAPDVGALLRAAHGAGKTVGAICDGTLALARSQLLDTRAHTGNAPGCLDASGYAGERHYRDVPHAVSDDGVVTAPGTAPVSFMAEVMRSLGHAGEQLDWYVNLHARQFIEQSGAHAS